jgi:hypothetical protein
VIGDVLIQTRLVGSQWIATLSVVVSVDQQSEPVWRQTYIASAPSEVDAQWGVIRQWMHVDE